MSLSASTRNNLDYQAMRRIRVRPLDERRLKEVIEPSYVGWINRHVGQQGALWDMVWSMTRIPKVGGALRRLGVEEQRARAYFAYLTLKPIETLLRKGAPRQAA